MASVSLIMDSVSSFKDTSPVLPFTLSDTLYLSPHFIDGRWSVRGRVLSTSLIDYLEASALSCIELKAYPLCVGVNVVCISWDFYFCATAKLVTTVHLLDIGEDAF